MSDDGWDSAVPVLPPGQSDNPSPASSGTEDDGWGSAIPATSSTSPPTGLASGEGYRPGPGFSPLGDLLGDIQGQKPQNVLPANAPAANPDTRNPVWAAFADIPGEIGSAAYSAGQEINNTLNPWSAQRRADTAEAVKNPSFFGGMIPLAEQTAGVGAGLASIPSLVASPVTGASRSLVGHALADTAPGVTYQEGKDEADILMSALAPEKEGVSSAIAAPDVPSSFSPGNLPPANIPKPPAPGPTDPFDITRSAGQISGDTRTLQTEQAARQGDSGEAAQSKAQGFDTQQAAQVQNAGAAVKSTFDPTGATPVDIPHEAGSIVSQGLQKAAENSQKNVDSLYETARNAPGTFSPTAFNDPEGSTTAESVLSRVKKNPDIILDPSPGGLTPGSNAAIKYLESAPQLSLESPTLQDVEQVRRNLLAYKNAAWSNSPTDGRAASAIVNAFDDHVISVADSSAFNGPQTSVQAWNSARAAHAEHQQTFAAGKNDPVGRTVQQILGGSNSAPLTGNDVADKLFGASGTNPNTTNVDLVSHLQSIFGPDSPEVSAMKQGMFSRIAGGQSGGQPWSHAKVSGNIDKFLNRDGIEMARTLYTPAERGMMQSYADMRKSLIPKPGTINPSGTSPFINRVIHAVTGHVGNAVGMMLGHHYLGFLPEGIREMAGAAIPSMAGKVSDIIQARKVSNMMPTTARALKQYQISAAKASKNYSPQTAKSLIYTSARLKNAIKPLGISLKDVLNQEKSNQDQNQNQNKQDQ